MSTLEQFSESAEVQPEPVEINDGQHVGMANEPTPIPLDVRQLARDGVMFSVSQNKMGEGVATRLLQSWGIKR